MNSFDWENRIREWSLKLDLSILARYIKPSDQSQAVKEFINTIRSSEQK